jgi:hypothetical protein
MDNRVLLEWELDDALLLRTLLPAYIGGILQRL